MPEQVKLVDLDRGVSERQAFGISYARPDKQIEQLDIHRDGGLRLPPHPVWHGKRTDWTADPYGDRNWQFQHHTLRWLNTLRWAALEGDGKARQEWLETAREWGDANIPASKTKSIFAWKDMADGNRAVQLSLGVPLAGPDDAWFVDLLQYHRDWLMDETHIVGKNHGLHQHVGLIVVGAALRDEVAKATAVDRMTKQFVTTFDEQGCNDEGSTVYHQLNLLWWAQAWKRAELEGHKVPTDVTRRLAAGGLVLAHMTLPNGQIPQIGDSSRSRVSGEISDETAYLASGGERGKSPLTRAIVLDGGYIMSRSGWGEERPMDQESHMLVRHGWHVNAHAHQDRGSVHLYSRGTSWLTDSGFHSYQKKDPIRTHLASREAHNLALLPGRKYDARAEVELVNHRITDSAHDFTLRDHGYPVDSVFRRIIYLTGPECWIVCDWADASIKLPIVQHWQVEPGIKARFRDRAFRLFNATSSMTMTWLGSGAKLSAKAANDDSQVAWVGTKWKTLKAGTRLVAESNTSARRLTTLIAPNSPKPLAIVDSRVTLAGDLSIELSRGGREWRVRADSEGVSVLEG
ncbi:heparinase II/III domain-containing protein [Brachybacterium tyrofermentans]|uniref:heparinase II/III domain-containing protein n=1 Tax=Brachybacterium tyrofermentans TaxID=47848 RepID=UPI003FD210A1